jgi:WD40 repeat protein
MTFEQALEIVNTAVFAAMGRHLTDVEVVIFRGSWDGQTYERIAEVSGYSVNYLKQDMGPKFWRLLTKSLGESVSKTNFRTALARQQKQTVAPSQPTVQLVEDDRAASPNLPDPPVQPPLVAQPSTIRADWGERVDVSRFYGRSTELTMLMQWIVSDRCRLVAVLGMGGIGKTSLSVKLANQILVSANLQGHHEFEYVIWRSLRNAPLLNTLLSDIILFLSDQQDTQADLNRLIYYMRQHRCLIVLDNLETILQPGHPDEYCADYADYGELLRLAGETVHQSCLLITSREKPIELGALEGDQLPVRCFKLSGLQQGADQILATKGLSGSVDSQQQLIQTYGGNPLALKIVSTSIHDLFDGDIEEFLAQKTALFNGIRKLLDQQFSRLSPLERTVMYWLAINREWTTVAELADDIVPATSKADLLETLKSLNGRSLLERQSSSYTQQPVVMEYVTESFVERVAIELATGRLSLFANHALLKTTVKDYVRESQVRVIVGAIANRLTKVFDSKQALEQQLQTVLSQLQTAQSANSNYAAGNLINLCCYLKLDLTNYDLSGLTICHAYLQQATLHHVNLSNANLRKSTFAQNFGGVLAVAFHPDGTRVASGDVNGEVCLWQITNGQKLQTYLGHTNWIWSVAFSPDGQLLASSGDDHTIRLWDVPTGQCLSILSEHTNWVRSTAFSPNGQILASASHDRTVRLWDINTERVIQVLQGHTAEVWSVAFSSDGHYLASSGDDRTIRLWDVQSGTCLKVLEGHADSIWSVAFSSISTQISSEYEQNIVLVSGSIDHTIKIWDVRTGRCLRTLQGARSQIFSLACAWNSNVTNEPVQHIIASGGDDRVIRLWDIDTGHCLKTLQSHTDSIWTIASSPNGLLFASGGNDQTVRLWDVNTGQCLRTLQGHANQVYSLGFSPDGKTLVSGHTDQQARVWDVQTGRALQTLQGHTSWIWSATFSPNGQMIISGSGDKTIKLWDAKTGAVLRTLQAANWVWSVVMSPDNRVIASGHSDHKIRLWDTVTGQVLKLLQGHTGWVRAVAFHPNGEMLASGSGDHTIKLWNRHTGDALTTLEGHTGAIRAIAFSPNGHILASGGEDHTIRLWKTDQPQVCAILKEHTNSIRAVAFSPDGQQLASGSEDYTLRLWDVKTGKCLIVLQNHHSQILTIAFSPDGTLLASSGDEGTIAVWDVATGTCVKTLRSDRPYENMRITGITGITEAQKATLRALGAVE